MKNLLQHKFEKYVLDISGSKYVYVLYNKNETIKNDTEISYEGPGNSYVELPIEMNIDISDNQIDYYRSKNRNMINSLSESKVDYNLFNKINEYSKDFFKYYHDKKNKNLEKITERSSILGSEDLIDHHNKGFILNLNKAYEDTFMQKSMNMSYQKSDFIKIGEDISDIETKGIDFFNDDLDYSLGMKSVSENLSYGEDQNNSESICIGFLVEKFDEENNIIGKKFINSIDKYSKNSKKLSISIKDSNVQYGKSYKYLVYPVFLATFPKKNDYHIVHEILICDSPYVVNIKCEEFEKPEAPEKLFFNYVRNQNKIILDWSQPHNVKNDIKGYYVFKRYSLEEPYKLIGVIDFTDEENIFQVNQTNVTESIIEKYKNHTLSFTDIDYDPNRISIYSICSFDAHGNFSNYSEQLSVVYDFARKNLLVNFVSSANAPLHMPNINIPRNVKFFGYQESIEDVVPIIKDKKKITLYCTPDFISVKNIDNRSELLLKENYILNIFKMENQKSFSDVISVRNFENINNE